MRLGVLPAKLDLRAYQGDSYALKVSLTQEGSTPLNLEGMEIEFSLAVVRGGRPAFKYTSAEGFVNILDPSAGEFQITVPEGETRKWKSVNYVYELTVRDNLGYAQTFLTGRFRVMREVAK